MSLIAQSLEHTMKIAIVRWLVAAPLRWHRYARKEPSKALFLLAVYGVFGDTAGCKIRVWR